jgi:hypothetical protein
MVSARPNLVLSDSRGGPLAVYRPGQSASRRLPWPSPAPSAAPINPAAAMTPTIVPRKFQ